MIGIKELEGLLDLLFGWLWLAHHVCELLHKVSQLTPTDLPRLIRIYLTEDLLHELQLIHLDFILNRLLCLLCLVD